MLWEEYPYLIVIIVSKSLRGSSCAYRNYLVYWPIFCFHPMSTRNVFSNIARRRLVPPQPNKQYVKWYMKWADTAHKAVVFTCVGVTRRTLYSHADDSILWCWDCVYVYSESEE